MAKTSNANLFADLFQEQHREIKQEAGKRLRDQSQDVVSDAPTWKTEGGILNIMDYITSPYGLDMRPFPVQRFVIKLYYHLPLETETKTIDIYDRFKEKLLFQFTEAEYLEYLYNEGRCNIKKQDHPRRELILIAGRRSGKTLFSSVFASYELYRLLSLGDPQAYYGLPPNNRIQIISVATDKDQAGLLFSELSGHISKFEYFAPYVQNSTQSFVNFRTPADIERNGVTQRTQDGKFISSVGKTGIRATFKASVAKGLRGAGNIVIIMDELAHFKNKGQASGKDVYDAVIPSAAAFAPKDPKTGLSIPGRPVESRIITITSPLGKVGQAYDLWSLAMAGGVPAENKLCLQIPTWEMNPSVDPGFFRSQYHADPKTFTIEYGAKFSDSSFSWWDREEDVLACCIEDLRPVERGIPRFPYYVGLDIGLAGDATVIAIGHTDPNGFVTLDYHEVWRAGEKWEVSNPHLQSVSCEYAKTLHQVGRIDFDSIADWILALSKRFTFASGIFDRWNGIPLEQALHKRNLLQFKSEFFTQTQASKVAQTFKTLVMDKKLRLYNHPVSPQSPKSPPIRELLALQADYLSKYVLIVHKPKEPKASDDFYDALSRMVFTCFEERSQEKYIAPVSKTAPHMSSYINRMKQIQAGNLPPRIDPRSRLGRKLLRR